MTPRRASLWMLVFAVAVAAAFLPHVLGGKRRPGGAAGRALPLGPPGRHPGVAMPDPRLTPGAVIDGVTLDRLCQPGYTRAVRDVPQALRQEVYARYGVGAHPPGSYVLDHLVPLELGGANTAPGNPTANLWPQPARGPAGAPVKDRLENYFHDEVCAGRMPLRAAQRAIASDWYRAWRAVGSP